VATDMVSVALAPFGMENVDEHSKFGEQFSVSENLVVLASTSIDNSRPTRKTTVIKKRITNLTKLETLGGN